MQKIRSLSNSAIAEFETTDSQEDAAFSTICLLSVRVSTLPSSNRFVPCLSGDLAVHPKIQFRILRTLLIVLYIFLYVHPVFLVYAQAVEDPLRPIRHLANQVYVNSQDMVHHGSEGHLNEIVDYGNHMIKRSEVLLAAVEALDPKTMKGKKSKIVASVKSMLDMAKKAVAFSEQNNPKLAMSAARKASFRAKQTRQRIEMIP